MEVWEVPVSSCPGLDRGPLMDVGLQRARDLGLRAEVEKTEALADVSPPRPAPGQDGRRWRRLRARAATRPPGARGCASPAGGHVPRIVRAPAVAVDVFGAGGGGDEQRQRAGAVARGDLAEAVLRHAERGGSRFVETMLTVIERRRQQSRGVFAYGTVSVQAPFAGQPTPPLLIEA